MTPSLATRLSLAVLALGCSARDEGYNYPRPVDGAPWTTGVAGGWAAGASGGGAAGTGGDDGGVGTPARDAIAVDEAIALVVPTLGCGQEPGQALGVAVRGTVMTVGTKPADAADSTKGDWAYEREYFVTLPEGYVPGTVYPLVVQATGCGGTGLNTVPLANNIKNRVIRVGLTPPPNAIGHAMFPNQGCYDDREGDDSVDWVFYEALYDKLAGLVCFDRNRVFVHGGTSTGGWFANELGCKYAGDALRPVRGVLINGGGLPAAAPARPTCTGAPMAGMWILHTKDAVETMANEKRPVDRALEVNGCAPASIDSARFDDYPISSSLVSTCKKVRGCPDLFPVVVCPLPLQARYSNEDVQLPGFATFIKQFADTSQPTP